jgi:hypothetical protein
MNKPDFEKMHNTKLTPREVIVFDVAYGWGWIEASGAVVDQRNSFRDALLVAKNALESIQVPAESESCGVCGCEASLEVIENALARIEEVLSCTRGCGL